MIENLSVTWDKMCDPNIDHVNEGVVSALARLEEQVRLLTLEVQVLQTLVARNQATLERQESACGKMSDHIDFVDSVYDHVRHPLAYITNLVSGVSELPVKPQALLLDRCETD